MRVSIMSFAELVQLVSGFSDVTQEGAVATTVQGLRQLHEIGAVVRGQNWAAIQTGADEVTVFWSDGDPLSGFSPKVGHLRFNGIYFAAFGTKAITLTETRFVQVINAGFVPITPQVSPAFVLFDGQTYLTFINKGQTTLLASVWSAEESAKINLNIAPTAEVIQLSSKMREIPTTLSEVGVGKTDFLAFLPKISVNQPIEALTSLRLSILQQKEALEASIAAAIQLGIGLDD